MFARFGKFAALIAALLMCGSAAIITKCDGEDPPIFWPGTGDRLDIVMAPDTAAYNCSVYYRGFLRAINVNGAIVVICQDVQVYPVYGITPGYP